MVNDPKLIEEILKQLDEVTLDEWKQAIDEADKELKKENLNEIEKGELK